MLYNLRYRFARARHGATGRTTRLLAARVTRHQTGQRGDVYAYSVPLNQPTVNAGG